MPEIIRKILRLSCFFRYEKGWIQMTGSAITSGIRTLLAVVLCIFIGGLSVGLLFSLSSCTKKEPDIEITQNIVFVMKYSNYAWGKQVKGYVIDNQGSIKSFDVSDQVELNLDESIEYYESLRESAVVGTVDMEDLKDNYRLLLETTDDSFTEPVSVGADMGAYVYSGIIYNSDGSYREILLGQFGDWETVNTDKNAAGILAWLQEHVNL